MQIFIDTANVDEIKEIAEIGIIDGVTTNPSLISKEGRDFKEVVKEICSIVDGPISAEVVSLKWQEMIKEAEVLAKINKNIVIKLPITKDGLIACHKLTKKGIKTNVTLVFSAAQALLAAKAGATYVSPFLGRLDDIGIDGITVVQDIAEMFSVQGITTKIIAASIRNPLHVVEVAKAGADIATIPYKIIMQMFKHNLTDIGIERFLNDWKKVPKAKTK